MDQQAEDLSKLPSTERLRLLLTSGSGRWLFFGVLGAVVSLFISFGSLTTDNDTRQTKLEDALAQLTNHALEPVAETSRQMSELLATIASNADKLADGQPKADIQKAAAELNRNIQFLQLYTQRMANREKRSEGWSIFTRAYADTSTKFTVEDARPYAFLVILVALALTFVGSILMIFFTKDAEILKFAFDTVKTLLGFFIGVATTFLGVSIH